ncbi:HDOD domain-containing protein [Aquincola sp. J276]|uniref:HDOD domain-containing protein n=1 Tax=Aquincola sp. J276 TaxID=2898432 RepID=UPI0021510CC2|nr:HDOD domain-containing protein [Aquincola sp. J276]MCR5866136.1 HDOD domain-containing protein [Aquincola sp. J276]
MPVDPELRSLDIDIPAQPEALVRLSLLLADDEINLDAAAQLIESDMALAAAVLKAVNSSMYGLKGRVQTVMQAVQYLGMREVAAITFEMGLRAAFPPNKLLEPVWQRAARRGLLMGRMGQFLGVDAWAAHSAGLFEECGKAVLLRHASDHYGAMLRAAPDDVDLRTLERAGFGVSHDALGAALCESWGLGAPSVASVRHHVSVQAGEPFPPQLPRPAVLALSAVAHILMQSPEQLEDVVARVAPQVPLDETLLLRAARKVSEQLAGRDAAATQH